MEIGSALRIRYNLRSMSYGQLILCILSIFCMLTGHTIDSRHHNSPSALAGADGGTVSMEYVETRQKHLSSGNDEGK